MIPRYTLPEMGAIWSDVARFEAMLRVELEVARAQSTRGQVPPEALAALETRSRVDVDRIAEIERTTDHDVIAFVSQVAESVGPEGRYLHLGLTSSDVVDTALALQLRAAGARLLGDDVRIQEDRRGLNHSPGGSQTVEMNLGNTLDTIAHQGELLLILQSFVGQNVFKVKGGEVQGRRKSDYVVRILGYAQPVRSLNSEQMSVGLFQGPGQLAHHFV
jgi:hypothetical protein